MSEEAEEPEVGAGGGPAGWLRGENIFAPLPAISPNTPEVEQVLNLIAERIGPTL